MSHVEEKIVFPSDDPSLKDAVIRVTESYDFDEEVNDYRLTEKKERKLFWKNFKMS